MPAKTRRRYQRQTSLLAASLVNDFSEAEDLGQEASYARFRISTCRRGEMAERVSAALAALPPRYRVPIRLFHVDGPSHSKIAETLGVPVGSVRSLVSRARRKLAPLLAEYGSEAVSQMDEVFQEQNEMSTGTNRFLHVANGHSVTGTIPWLGFQAHRAFGLTGYMKVRCPRGSPTNNSWTFAPAT